MPRPCVCRRLSLPSRPRAAPQTCRSLRIPHNPTSSRHSREKRQDRIRSRCAESAADRHLCPLAFPSFRLLALLVRQAKAQPADSHVIVAILNTFIECFAARKSPIYLGGYFGGISA